MRYSKLFGKTKKSVPSDKDSVNARLLTQAGFVEKLCAGVYNYLPLGLRVLKKVENIIRDEMNKAGGQELLMPVLHPISVWESTGRTKSMDEILFRTGPDKEFILGPSHEETITPLAGSFIKSYKDLPLSLYQIQEKFRYEARAKSGVLRGREFGMKDLYSFHTDEEDLDRYYEIMKQAYSNVFNRCGLKSYIIEASGGAFSDKFSHEFQIPTNAGEDTIILCEKCGFAQNLEIATGKITEDENTEEEKALKMIDAVHGPSVEDTANFHKVSPSKVLKSVVYEVEEVGLLGVLIRGDLSINEVKLEKYLKKRLRPASAESLKSAGLVPGFISPVSNPVEIPFIADHSVTNMKNFVTGANVQNFDFENVNIGRDFQIKDFTDIVEVRNGFKCPKCESSLKEIKAVEAGNIFKLGTKFSDSFNLKYLDKDGVLKPVVMGCYGIGTTRLVGTIVEASHDEKGMIWPKNVAPYSVHLLKIGNDDTLNEACEKLYKELSDNGIEVLYDDRDESAGLKLNDADLIGLPLRIVLSKRTLSENKVEVKERIKDDFNLIDISEILEFVKNYLNS
ncbi:MAG: proline--tRNA ligase [Candidatus Gracilibacteria bacterium]|jgi:prolyl-tRNA synthetase|nr:proline--tRNA ligase [Candidatus Gracilibacteria bacterium]